jgi:hypothetical protein
MNDVNLMTVDPSAPARERPTVARHVTRRRNSLKEIGVRRPLVIGCPGWARGSMAS